MKIFKERLTAIRESRDMTKSAVARDLGLPRTTYSNYETGQNEPDLKMIVTIAEYYGVTTDYLLGHEWKHPLQLPSDINTPQAAEEFLYHLNLGQIKIRKERRLELARALLIIIKVFAIEEK